jgi:purine-binding chemotaxis protein CheW
MSSASDATVTYCTFFVDGHYFGVQVDQVQEILLRQQMTRVALAPPVVAGLINLRGQIVTALDLRRRLGMPERAADASALNVVVRSDDGPVALLVDKTGDVLTLGHEHFEAPPETLRGELRTLLLGAYKLPGRLLLVLDLPQVTHVACELAS